MMGDRLWCGAAVLVGCQALAILADDKPATHKVVRGAFKVEVSLDGVFESEQMTPVVLHPKSWTTFKVLKALPQGTVVKKGDQLVWLEMEEAEDSLRDQQTALEQAERDLALARLDLQGLEQTQPIDLAHAELARKHAEEDLQSYLELLKPLEEKSIVQRVKMIGDFVEYAEEELKQLEKMYKADDLTEETEEIILKRARNDVALARDFLDQAKVYSKLELQMMPRADVTARDAVRTAALAHEKLRATAPITLSKARIALAKTERDFAKTTEKLAELKADVAAMQIKAPADGVLYYGQCDRGTWSNNSLKFQVGEALQPATVFMTIVQPRPLRIRASVPEKDLAALAKSPAGRAIPTADPSLRFPCRLQSIAPIPLSAGSFDGTLSVEVPPQAPIVAGMGCKATLVLVQNPDALTIPPAQLFTDELDDAQHYVYVHKEGGPEKRPVKVGQKTDKKVEILEGLQAGEEILMEEPKK